MSDVNLPVPEDRILGTRVFENVLFSPDSERPVDVLTGKPPARSMASVDDARAFAQSLSDEKPYVAKAASVESQIETQSGPYSGCVFHHFSIVGGMDMHKAYAAVWDSPEFDVEVTPDYSSGDLRITVTRC